MADYLFSAKALEPFLDKGSEKYASYRNTVIKDYWLALVSRELSLQGRKEVLTGKAKFGIFSDGKEVAQIAMAKAFEPGDHRSGYYRDQTLMMALGLSSVKDYLAQMYSFAESDPFSGGRQMVAHFATPYHEQGEWIDVSNRINTSSGISCTGGQMARGLGLAYASKLYRALDMPPSFDKFSRKGNEVCFCTIGDASTSEGVFWETVNAAGVLEVPLVIVVWDDGYGISVPIEKQTTKSSISAILEGFVKESDTNGIDLYTAQGWDYVELCDVFQRAAKQTRQTHTPSVIHVKNLTQQQGHSTSGSHERYKSKERLQWEHEFDCNVKMTDWMTKNELLSNEEVNMLAREARAFVREQKQSIWREYQVQAVEKRVLLRDIYDGLLHDGAHQSLSTLKRDLSSMVNPPQSEILQNARQLKYALITQGTDIPQALLQLIDEISYWLKDTYSSHLYSSDSNSALNVPVIPPVQHQDSPLLSGYQILNEFFDKAFTKFPELIAFGEDVGHIGDVNQGMAGLQSKYGETRIVDTGIREWTIVGQGLGAAMRGFRPIAEIQYLDYILYALPILSDDVASLRYRSNNLQQAPLIIRTRGHRLEGIWHSGSPMGVLLHSVRGMYICVPRNMTQAAGMYNTLLQSNDPAIVIECLNGYRQKEVLPQNIGEFTVPLGIPEILIEGVHITMVSYGSCIRPAMNAVEQLSKFGISAELIDIQCLLPFDTEHTIVHSLKKTSRLLIIDEDVPGGASAFILQQIMEVQGGFEFLDTPPRTLTARDHRPPYGSDGDYFAKPQAEDIVELAYEIVYETKML